MAEFNKKTPNSFWHSPLFLFVLFCMSILFAYNMVGLIKKERETAKKKAIILDQINNLNAREKDLSSSITKIKTSDGTEEIIREKYQVVKPGEKMIVIVDENKTQNEKTEKNSSNNFWQWLKSLFN